MATENAGWRAPRIHGELRKLGFSVSERTISRHLRSFRTRPHTGATWKTFLDNHRHQITATDFFTVPTATFKNIYVLFIIQHVRRRIIHFAVTRNPSAELHRETNRLRRLYPRAEMSRPMASHAGQFSFASRH
jgi:putative transposase